MQVQVGVPVVASLAVRIQQLYHSLVVLACSFKNKQKITVEKEADEPALKKTLFTLMT
jgi:hypothetical protein